MKTARLSPPNSLLLILDPDVGELPASMQGEFMVATDSALAIGTLSEIDGETQITFASADEAIPSATLSPRWRGTLRTGGRLAAMTVAEEVLIEIDAASSVDLEVFTNDRDEPDQVWVSIRGQTGSKSS